MKKPKELCEIRLSEKDVAAAVELYLNEAKFVNDTKDRYKEAAEANNRLEVI